MAVEIYKQKYSKVHRLSQSQYKSNNPKKRTKIRTRPWNNKALSGLYYDIHVAYQNYIGHLSEKC